MATTESAFAPVNSDSTKTAFGTPSNLCQFHGLDPNVPQTSGDNFPVKCHHSSSRKKCHRRSHKRSKSSKKRSESVPYKNVVPCKCASSSYGGVTPKNSLTCLVFSDKIIRDDRAYSTHSIVAKGVIVESCACEKSSRETKVCCVDCCPNVVDSTPKTTCDCPYRAQKAPNDNCDFHDKKDCCDNCCQSSHVVDSTPKTRCDCPHRGLKAPTDNCDFCDRHEKKTSDFECQTDEKQRDECQSLDRDKYAPVQFVIRKEFLQEMAMNVKNHDDDDDDCAEKQNASMQNLEKNTICCISELLRQDLCRFHSVHREVFHHDDNAEAVHCNNCCRSKCC